ncbi:MAG: hypothetical protein DI537_14750 [Stutzerimonas stutzeri]|nr:MAG: hypothetical protein DI537_14750 [Stutzerimonas stutzeri]
MPDIIAAFSTDIEAQRELPVENDYYSNFVHEDLQQRDAQLYGSKWFDYRFMTPLQATALYIEEYGKAYRRLYAVEFDRDRSGHIQVPTIEGVISVMKHGKRKWIEKQDAKKIESSMRAGKVDFNGFWNGRQVADFIGMPYGHYVSLALSFRLRRWKQGYMPRATHLYQEYDVERIVERWGQMQQGEIFLAEHSAYMVQNYQGLKAQDDYHEWLFASAASRGTMANSYLAQFVNEDRLPIEKVRARLDDHAYTLFERELQQSH